MRRRIPVYVLVAALLTGGVISWAVSRNDSQISDIQDGLIRACEANKRPGGLRYIIATRIKGDLQQSKKLPYRQFFPNIPPATLKALIAHQNADSRKEIHDLLGVDCAAQYK